MPQNILLRSDVPVSTPLPDGQHMLDYPFTPVFADFTSSFLTSDDPKSISTAGGGTYDYMAPEQFAPPFPLPNFKMDVYALAITLLEVVTGRRPFQDADVNRHMKMAMIKEGRVMDWAMRDFLSEQRINAIAKQSTGHSGMEVKALLELGLAKMPEERVDAEAWSRLW